MKADLASTLVFKREFRAVHSKHQHAARPSAHGKDRNPADLLVVESSAPPVAPLEQVATTWEEDVVTPWATSEHVARQLELGRAEVVVAWPGVEAVATLAGFEVVVTTP